jgi:hypothetical protein
MTTSIKNKDKSKKDARDIRAEALRIANSQHVEGQTREHSRLIAVGIQRGIEQYLRQQSEKARELDKRVKKVKRLAETVANHQPQVSDDEVMVAHYSSVKSKLPWILLVISWGIFAIYLWLNAR